MSFQHRLIRIGIVASLRIFRISDVKHVSYDQRPSGLAPVDIKGFVDLSAVSRQFESSAHLPALRALFVRHKLASIPVSSDFLMVFVRGFLQLAPIGNENKHAVLIVRDVHFRILQRETQRTRGANHLLYLFVNLGVPPAIILSPTGSSSAGVTSSRIATTWVATARVTTTPSGV